MKFISAAVAIAIVSGSEVVEEEEATPPFEWTEYA